MQNITPILEKYNNFKDAQIISFTPPNEETISMKIAIQDDDGQDTHHISFTFTNIHDSRVLQNHVLAFLDMMNGISIVKEHNLYAFALGKYDALLGMKNAPLYVIAAELSVEEKAL